MQVRCGEGVWRVVQRKKQERQGQRAAGGASVERDDGQVFGRQGGRAIAAIVSSPLTRLLGHQMQ